jgi:uncharacterized protein YwqG
MPACGRDDLANSSATELEQAYAESIQAAKVSEHVGRHNRLIRHSSKIFQELKARGRAREVFARLAKHSDGEVRRWAQGNLDWLDRPTQTAPAQAATKGPFWPHLQWQSQNPPPPAMTRGEMAERLQGVVPEFRDRLMAFSLPAICLWPRQQEQIPATASRFGGSPLAPAGWRWPVANEEPLLFVGQINCAEFHGLPGAEQLPPSGLLAFFGDHDAVTGCFPFDHRCVFYWPQEGDLVPAAPDIEPIEIFPSCVLTPKSFFDLPHPDSRVVSGFGLSPDQRRSYLDVWRENRAYGIPEEYVGYGGFSKLFGWPDLVQSELWRFESQNDARLLLQVDHYCNGEKAHSWGPGGTLFYVLPERDLRARVFEGCELEGQFT